MFDLETTGPVPADLTGPKVFEKVRIPLARLVEALDEQGEALTGRRFVDCVIAGPAIAVQSDATRISNCHLGDPQGDVRNLFLRTTGPKIIGGVALNDCVFEGCLFIGVGFAGTEDYVRAFVARLTPSEA